LLKLGQKATEIAKLARSRLTLERQQIPSTFIQVDYWEAPTEGSITSGSEGDRGSLDKSSQKYAFGQLV